MAATYNNNPYRKKNVRGRDLIPLSADVKDFVKLKSDDDIAGIAERYAMKDNDDAKRVDVITNNRINIPLNNNG